MNRETFILKLRKELSKLPPEEIVAATEYFEEIFTDATEGLGEEDRLSEEKRLVEEFGSPKKIAAQIRADYAARLLKGDESILDKKPGAGRKLSAVWWVIIGLCSAPVSIPLVGCAFVLAVSLIIVVISIYIGITACLAGALATIVIGCVFLSSSVASGIMLIGCGMAALGLGAAAAVAMIIGTRKLIHIIGSKVTDYSHRRKIKKMTQSDEGETEWVFTGTENCEKNEDIETNEGGRD